MVSELAGKMGYPIQAEGMMGAFYPPNLLLFGLLPAPVAQNLSVLWPFFVAALKDHRQGFRRHYDGGLGACLYLRAEQAHHETR